VAAYRSGVFAIGPGTAAIMATPRYIRKRNVVVLGYLSRTTEIYAIASLLVLVFGLIDPQAADGGQPDGARAQAELKTAMVEHGRIAMMSGIVALIWLAILVPMVWGAS
jgi:hypothetical protein